ncbi:hypothetical protein [Aquitalea sp. ASV15]|uniref:hypothetical protein n=1 Tax=Aquitalea sp. ASV15 TaxID=2795104 RepID=UPI0018EDBFC0|nr:hypothetical protein [Aquitalea sp. ASV15]
MAGKKTFERSDLTGHVSTAHLLKGENASQVACQRRTIVDFPADGNATLRRTFDFARWYGVGIDDVTSACQLQIERFLATGEGDCSIATIVAYCSGGLHHFLSYCALVASTKAHSLGLADVDRDLIDGFLLYLKSTGTKTTVQKNWYTRSKSVLVALGKRGLKINHSGDKATFPKNPFPNTNRKFTAEDPLSTRERKALILALNAELSELYRDDCKLTGHLLACALWAVALRTGRNTAPLLEMTTDCLQAHPKSGMKLLVVYKRRGNNTNKVAVRDTKDIAGHVGVMTDTVRLIERVQQLTAPLRLHAPNYLRDRLWLFPPRRHNRDRPVTVLTNNTLLLSIKSLVTKSGLRDANEQPLVVNISRLRKTFENRVFELANGSLVVAAKATGHSAIVADRHYMTPGEHAAKNWKFMGVLLANELGSGSLSTQDRTPSGQCSDNKHGQFAPKNGGTCFNFLSCIRCKNYVVTADDLHKVFSFYWLIVRERNLVGKRKWAEVYGHIVRLIDRDIADFGVRRKIFTQAQVDSARDTAKVAPHPYWAARDMLESID